MCWAYAWTGSTSPVQIAMADGADGITIADWQECLLRNGQVACDGTYLLHANGDASSYEPLPVTLSCSL